MRTIAVLALTFIAAFAQPPAFEVASIKPNTSGSGRSSTHTNDSTVIMQNVSLKQIIETAFGVKDYSFTGPGWLDTAKFDISAKLPSGADPHEIREMTQALLAERFKLAVHRESKVLPAYGLVVAKGGPKLKEVEAGKGSSMNTDNNHLTASHTNMERLADFLARRMDRPVVDETGLKGAYDFELEWAAEEKEAKSDEKSPPTLFTALQEQLGLRLQAKKMPLETLVVDHVERLPTEN